MLSFHKAFLTLGLLACVPVAQASPITLNADHFSVTYDDVQAGLYKQGSLSGSLDTVYFQPNTFAALSGGNAVSTPALLQLTFSINPGYAFTGFNFTERGDYFLFGGGAVNVAASVQAVNAATSASTILDLAPGLPLTQTGRSTSWELTGTLSTLGLGSPQTLVVNLDNSLFASASTSGLGFIQKTYAGFQVMTEPVVSVPEPASWALLLAGVMAAVLVGGRRRERAPSMAQTRSIDV
ncbi:MAG: PEP-CTERM sorting domain-containing protein [Thiobacillus sp.]